MEDKTCVVAIKVIDMKKTENQKFDEINIMKMVQSKHVVKILDAYEIKKISKCYIVMEYCNQGSLLNKDLKKNEALQYFR